MTCVTFHVNNVTNSNALIRNYVFLLSDLSSLLSLSLSFPPHIYIYIYIYAVISSHVHHCSF